MFWLSRFTGNAGIEETWFNIAHLRQTNVPTHRSKRKSQQQRGQNKLMTTFYQPQVLWLCGNTGPRPNHDFLTHVWFRRFLFAHITHLPVSLLLVEDRQLVRAPTCAKKGGAEGLYFNQPWWVSYYWCCHWRPLHFWLLPLFWQIWTHLLAYISQIFWIRQCFNVKAFFFSN